MSGNVCSSARYGRAGAQGFVGGDLIMKTCLAFAVVIFLPAGSPQSAPTFTRKPVAAQEGGGFTIRFAVSRETDVEVAILDDRGKVVRHLAAGVLGKNAPEPLKRDSLEQEVAWDGRDDAGKPASAGPFKARVRLGVQPRLDGILGRNDNTLSGEITAIAANPKGELFVLFTELERGRAEIRVLDRDGRYLRTIMPYPASTPAARTESVGHVIID